MRVTSLLCIAPLWSYNQDDPLLSTGESEKRFRLGETLLLAWIPEQNPFRQIGKGKSVVLYLLEKIGMKRKIRVSPCMEISTMGSSLAVGKNPDEFIRRKSQVLYSRCRQIQEAKKGRKNLWLGNLQSQAIRIPSRPVGLRNLSGNRFVRSFKRVL